jgi:hypothetical protein
MATITAEDRDAIRAAALQLQPALQKTFVATVVTALEREPVVGPGIRHRIIAQAQRSYFEPPSFIGPRVRWSR